MMNNYKQQVVDFFDSRTAYDDEGRGHCENAEKLLNFVTVKPNQTVLDLATGTGLIAISTAKSVGYEGSIIGVDMSSGMLAQAQAKIKSQNIKNLELIEADIEEIDFDDEKFDLIFCCSAFVFIPDIPKLLDKCYRWLKPGGCLAFTASCKGSHLSEVKVEVCKRLFDLELPHIIRPIWTPEKCDRLLKASGFHNIEIAKHLFRTNKINSDYGLARIENDFYPRGNPLLNLSEADLKLLQVEYQKAIDLLIADGEEQQEAYNLYVKAWKRS